MCLYHCRFQAFHTIKHDFETDSYLLVKTTVVCRSVKYGAVYTILAATNLQKVQVCLLILVWYDFVQLQFSSCPND